MFLRWIILPLSLSPLFAFTPAPLYTPDPTSHPLAVEFSYLTFRIKPTTVEQFCPLHAPLEDALKYPAERRYQGFQVAIDIPIQEKINIHLSYLESYKTKPQVSHPIYPRKESIAYHFDITPPSTDVFMNFVSNSHHFQLQYLDLSFNSKMSLYNKELGLVPKFGARFCRLYQATTTEMAFFYLEGPPIEEERHYDYKQLLLGGGPQIGCKVIANLFVDWPLLNGLQFFAEPAISGIYGPLFLANDFYVDNGFAKEPILCEKVKKTTLTPVIDLSYGVSYDFTIHLLDRRVFEVNLSVAGFLEKWITPELNFRQAPDQRGLHNLTLSKGLLYSVAITF